MNPILETKGIIKNFYTGSRETINVLKGIDLTIERQKLTILKGRSGSGKTTLLNILSMLDRPTEGSLFIEGTEMSKMSDTQREQYRRDHMGFVFQNVALIPFLTAYENVNFALKLADDKCDRDKRIKELLTAVGLEDRMHHMPAQLSGGEQQRVAIARSVAHHPKLVFVDEPTGALDTKTGHTVMDIFHKLNKEQGKTIVLITHAPELAEETSRIITLSDGNIIGERINENPVIKRRANELSDEEIRKQQIEALAGVADADKSAKED